MEQALQVVGRRRVGPGVLLTGGFAALAVLVLVLIPRPNDVPVASVDVAAVAAGSQAGLGFVPAVPCGLPSGWTARDAIVQRGTDGLATWHLTYLTPTGEVAGVQQTVHATSAWENRQVTDGREQGARQVAGLTWLIRSRTDRGVTSLVNRQAGGVTTVVTGSGGTAEVDRLAVSLAAQLTVDRVRSRAIVRCQQQAV